MFHRSSSQNLLWIPFLCTNNWMIVSHKDRIQLLLKWAVA